MKRCIIVLLSLFLGIFIIRAEEIEFIYSDWIDYYPEGIAEIRIETQDRYRWFKIENDERIETEEYYDYLEDYEKIEESKKTFYRVINNEYIIIDVNGELVRDPILCRKVFCLNLKIEPYNPNEPPPEPKEEEIIVNPNTYDPTYKYYYSFIISFILLIVINIRKIYLVMSNRWK